MSKEDRFCPDCGTAVGEGFQFCPSCGISLLSAPSAAEKPVPRVSAPLPAPQAPADERKAERRLVSVMFVDLVGFTAMSERADPEDVREMQSRYFESARSIVARFGGSLEKFIGDAVMAVWGSPVARENDAERAVRAVLELVRSVGSMGGGVLIGGQLAARGAVTTGEAAVSFNSDYEGMVTGDLVNTASRLQEAAEAGTVLVDDATRRAVGDAGAFSAAGAKALKGKSSPVRAWRATDLVGLERTEAAAGHGGPFVGRRPELDTLLGLAKSVATERRATLVSIIGVAGIGKSRLGRELELRMHDTPGMRWYRGRPPRWGQGTAFAPLAEMVRRSVGIAENEPAEVVRRTLAEALNRLIEDEAERTWLEPRVQVLLDPSEPVQTERDELFAAWRRYLEADAAEGSTVLVFEDLHWADTETLDFIDYLATWSRRHPLLLLTMARPELLERRPTWGAGIPQFRSLHLDRLTDAEVDELLHALAPDLPREMAALARKRAEGVPLYAVEIARMMSELVAEGGAAVASVNVPESLHALLAARIDALPELERSVLLMAAVLGRRFRPDGLAALSGMDHRELNEIVGTLARREFLTMDDEPRSPGRGQLSFVQDLSREIAYGTLSRHDRRRYHLAAIEYLEAADGPETIEPIAEHLVAAHGATRSRESDVEALSDRALAALRQAADHAAGQHAPHRALGHLERALLLTDDSTARAELAESAALVARAAARFAVAEVHLREAIGLRDGLGDSAAAARDRAHLASVLLQAQHSDSAITELEQAWEAYSAASASDATLAHLAAELARAHMLQADMPQAVEWAERAVRAAQSSPADAGPFAIDARVTLGTALAQGGEPDEGSPNCRRRCSKRSTAAWPRWSSGPAGTSPGRRPATIRGQQPRRRGAGWRSRARSAAGSGPCSSWISPGFLLSPPVSGTGRSQPWKRRPLRTCRPPIGSTSPPRWRPLRPCEERPARSIQWTGSANPSRTWIRRRLAWWSWPVPRQRWSTASSPRSRAGPCGRGPDGRPRTCRRAGPSGPAVGVGGACRRCHPCAPRAGRGGALGARQRRTAADASGRRCRCGRSRRSILCG